ncbi:unnamed protein product [Clonostachys byssicola]|uniref:Uncharacterized protein n=1 Tax=Clonostachys byssicola TaxID=160290 RepID=A0A9N9XWE4_9HYPO|nr:unnamed protein product [Clonostachys byssicola]
MPDSMETSQEETREEVFHFARLEMESANRRSILYDLVEYPYRPCAVPAVAKGWACGTMAAGPGSSFDLYRNLANSLYSWLQRQWLNPYRTNIEFERFIAKTIYPQCVNWDTDITELAEILVSMHETICSQVPIVSAKAVKNEAFYYRDIVYCHPEVHIVQPIFRAMLIILPSDNFNVASMDREELGSTPVYLVLTNCTMGLSAPIPFEPILDKVERTLSDRVVQVTLKDAITFVKDLEDRENAIYGPLPNPAKMDQELYETYVGQDGFLVIEMAKRMGDVNDLPCLKGPSSGWVTRPSKYTRMEAKAAIDRETYQERLELDKRERWIKKYVTREEQD